MNDQQGNGDSQETDKGNPVAPTRIPRENCEFNCGTCGECGRILASTDDESDEVNLP